MSESQLSETMQGVLWWNALTETERTHWLTVANSAVPAAAWTAFKRASVPNCDARVPRHPILFAFRELIIAAEEAGWDIGQNKTALDQARAAYANLRMTGLFA